MEGKDRPREAVETKAVASSADVHTGEASCEDLGAWGEVGEGGYIFLAFDTGKVFFEDLCRGGGVWKNGELVGGKFSWRGV